MLVGAMYLKIALASDDAGYLLKERIKDHLNSITEHKFQLNDWGCYSTQSQDYVTFTHQVSEQVHLGKADVGILISGSGNGISMTANKWSDIRSAVCWNEEVAQLARRHNDANIISLPASFITPELAIKCVETFLSTEFDGVDLVTESLK